MPHGEGLALPAYQSAHAAGLDLLAAVPEDAPLMLAPGQHALVPTGLTIALPPGYEAQVRPRSGLAAKHGVTVLNAPGTVDADYRGEIGVLLINHGDAPFAIRRGERIAQMVIAPVARAELVPAVSLSDDRARQRRLRFDRPLIRAKAPDSFSEKSRRSSFNHRIFLRPGFAFTVWTLTRRAPVGDIVIRFAHGGRCIAGRKVVRFGANMSGVIVAMRRTLLSCTSLARNGLIALATAHSASIAPAYAGDLPLLDTISAYPRSQSPGIRGADHGAGAARLFGGGRDPADAHPRSARHEARRGCAPTSADCRSRPTVSARCCSRSRRS